MDPRKQGTGAEAHGAGGGLAGDPPHAHRRDVTYGRLANLVLTLHGAFVLFVVFGGLLSARWPRAAWVHLPAALWGALIEFGGWICPLTPLENHLRSLAGQAGYAGGYVEHYLLAWLYPTGLTRNVQFILGVAVLVFNAAVYAWVVSSRRRHRAGR